MKDEICTKGLVFRQIIEKEPIFRAKIARSLGLSEPTVMKITNELIRDGLVEFCGKGVSTGGKPPQLLRFCSDSKYIIGIDVGATHIYGIITNLSNEILSDISVDTKDFSFESILRQICDVVDYLFEEGKKKISQFEKGNVLGIGVGMPGLIEPKTGRVIFSPILKLSSVDFVEPLVKKYGLKVRVENTTRAMAMGELCYGSAKGQKNFLCVNLGYGIGAALVLDHKIYYGNNGAAGELGHVRVTDEKILCSCGKYGCLEAVASGSAISLRAQKSIETENSLILKLAKKKENITAKTVYDAAKQNDAFALEIITDSLEKIAVAIANVLVMYDIEFIVLEGGVAKAGDILVDFLSAKVDEYRMKNSGKKAKIIIGKLGDKAAVFGASAFLFDHFVNSGGELV